MQARAGFSNLARHGGKRNQAAGVVGAMHMLAHPHTPQNHGRSRGGVGTRDFAQGRRRDATDRCHRFRTVSLNIRAQCFEVIGAPGNEVLIGETFLNDGMNQRIEERDIRIGLKP